MAPCAFERAAGALPHKRTPPPTAHAPLPPLVAPQEVGSLCSMMSGATPGTANSAQQQQQQQRWSVEPPPGAPAWYTAATQMLEQQGYAALQR